MIRVRLFFHRLIASVKQYYNSRPCCSGRAKSRIVPITAIVFGGEVFFIGRQFFAYETHVCVVADNVVKPFFLSPYTGINCRPKQTEISKVLDEICSGKLLPAVPPTHRVKKKKKNIPPIGFPKS